MQGLIWAASSRPQSDCSSLQTRLYTSRFMRDRLMNYLSANFANYWEMVPLLVDQIELLSSTGLVKDISMVSSDKYTSLFVLCTKNLRVIRPSPGEQLTITCHHMCHKYFYETGLVKTKLAGQRWTRYDWKKLGQVSDRSTLSVSKSVHHRAILMCIPRHSDKEEGISVSQCLLFTFYLG